MAVNFACHPSRFEHVYRIIRGIPARLCHMIEAYNYGCTALFSRRAGLEAENQATPNSIHYYDECNEVASSMALRVQNALLNSKWKRIDVDLASKMFKIQMPLDVYPSPFSKKSLEAIPKTKTYGSINP